MENKYYKHAGDFSLGGTLITLIAGLAAGLILAAIYGYLIIYIPFIFLKCFAAIGFGCGMGALLGYLLKKSQVRNNYVAVGIVTTVALISLYFSWSVWLFALIRREEENVSLLLLTLMPHVQFSIVQHISENGVWQYNKTAVAGASLWVIWLAEAALIMGCAILIAVKNVSDPFCETCQVWCEKTPCVAEFGLGDKQELRMRMEGKDFEYLKSLGRRPQAVSQWYQLDLYDCPKCNLLNTLVISQVILTEHRGQLQEKYKRIVNHLLITPTEVSQLRKLNEELWLPAPIRENS